MIAFVVVGLAFVLRLGLSGLVGDELPYITFYPAVMLTATLCGLGPGFMATGLSALLAWFWFIPPEGSFSIWMTTDKVGLLLFSGMGVFMTLVSALYHEARQRLAKAEKDLAVRSSEEWLRLTREASNSGAWEWDLRANKSLWSEELWRLYGLEPHSCVPSYEAWRRTVHPDDLPKVEQVVQKAVREGAELNLEWRVRDRDGTERWLMSRGRPLRDTDGRIARYVGILIDITERKRAEEALREADRRKSEFLGVLSHELRNPLAPIRNSVYLLDRAPPGSAQAARAKNIISRQTEHLTRLIDDLLDVTRISRGKIELQRALVDLRNVVRRTCDDHRALFHSQDLKLHVETSDPVWVEADDTRIAQVVGNLLQNAARFSREDGIVMVTVGTAEGQAEIRVRDNGIGIAPDLLPRLFEPFVQADGGLARTKGGLGLGLALVKGLVELHGGSVRACSEGVGRGSEFVVELPLASAPEQPATIPIAPTATRAMEILVIEDNVDAAQTMAEVLAMEGHRVLVATDGRSGIAKARELRPEVILCDIGLPDVDGYEIARALRADDALRSTRLIALSGYAQPEDRRRAKEAGFDAHLPKPPALDVLLAAVVAES